MIEWNLNQGMDGLDKGHSLTMLDNTADIFSAGMALLHSIKQGILIAFNSTLCNIIEYFYYLNMKCCY